MSNIGQALFGGSKSSSTSDSRNQAYPMLQQAYGGQINDGTQAAHAASSLLTGGPGSDAAFNNYKNSAGFNSTLDAGSRAITNNNAAKGFLQSGATGQALSNFGQQTNQQYFKDYLSQLMGVSNQGLQAGGLVGGAGQVSKGTQNSSQKPGIGGFLGSVASTAASDPRLKMDVTFAYVAANGLTVYDFRYIWDAHTDPVTRGYMADEVQEKFPHAIGALLAGEFLTVCYDKLLKIEE